MTIATVYTVLADGATSEEVLGVGRLVDPRIVLADEDLRRRLTQLISTEARFRVGLADAVDGQLTVEVIDAEELHSGRNANLMVLSLCNPSQLPPEAGEDVRVDWRWCEVLSPPPKWC